MKLKQNILFAVLFISLTACHDYSKCESKITSGMVKISIMYPNEAGKTFNMNYYKENHMPMLAELFGKTLKYYHIDEGISGRTPDEPAAYLAIGHLYFNALSDYQDGFKIHGKTILGDIPNYTNIKPAVQISKVIK